MADVCTQYTIAGIKINDTTALADRLLTSMDNGHILGLDGAPIRHEIDDQGQSDGSLVFPKFFAGRIITFQGEVHIQSVPGEDTVPYVTAINVLEAAVISALQGILNTPSALTWTPTGGSGKSINVTYGTTGGEIQFDGPMLPGERTFTFQLFAPDPTIT